MVSNVEEEVQKVPFLNRYALHQQASGIAALALSKHQGNV